MTLEFSFRTFITHRLRPKAASIAVVAGLAVCFALPTYAKHNDHAPGRPENPGKSNAAPGHNKAEDDADDGQAVGRTVVLVGLNGAIDSFVRLSNFGDHGGEAHVVLHNGITGLEIGRWISPVIPSHGAAKLSLADIADAALPEGDPIPAVIVLEVRARFNGQIQHLGFNETDTVLTDLTACRRLATPRHGLGYVAGPDRDDALGAIRIINRGAEAAAVKLIIYDAATGVEAGRWTSPTIASFASGLFTLDMIAGESTPQVAALDAATIGLEVPRGGIELSYLENLPGETPIDVTAGCALRGGEDDEDDEDEEEVDQDE